MESFLTTAADLKASREAAGFICFSDTPLQAITPEKTNSIILIPDPTHSLSPSVLRLKIKKNPEYVTFVKPKVIANDFC